MTSLKPILWYHPPFQFVTVQTSCMQRHLSNIIQCLLKSFHTVTDNLHAITSLETPQKSGHHTDEL